MKKKGRKKRKNSGQSREFWESETEDESFEFKDLWCNLERLEMVFSLVYLGRFQIV